MEERKQSKDNLEETLNNVSMQILTGLDGQNWDTWSLLFEEIYEERVELKHQAQKEFLTIWKMNVAQILHAYKQSFFNDNDV